MFIYRVSLKLSSFNPCVTEMRFQNSVMNVAGDRHVLIWSRRRILGTMQGRDKKIVGVYSTHMITSDRVQLRLQKEFMSRT